MKFREKTVKEIFENPQCKAVIQELAPELLKFPIMLVANHKCGDIFDMAMKQNMLSEEKAKAIIEAIGAVL